MRLSRWFSSRPGRAESDLEREIAHHLYQLLQEYQRQGYSREDALRMARREFGASGQIKEECRDQRRGAWLNGLRQDLLFGIRTMRRTPVVTLAAVLSLALGIGANTAIVSLCDIVLWRDLPLPNPQQVVLVHWQGPGFPRELADGAAGSMSREDGVDVADFFSYSAFQQLRKSASGRASVAAFTFSDGVSVSFAGRPTVAQERAVSGNFLSTLQVRPQLGRLLSDDDDRDAAPAAVVVSHRFWERALASDPNVVGRTIAIDNHPRVVAGVLERGFYGMAPGDATEIYTPLHHGDGWLALQKNALADNRFWCVSIVLRRAPGVTDARVRPVLDTVFPATWSAQPKDPKTAPRIRLDEGRRGLGFLRREFRNPLLVLGGLVTLLLIIACTNIANLLLARAVARRKEIAVRVSLGCSRGRLMRQFLTESALLALLGGAASLAVAYLTANLLGRFLRSRDNFPIAVGLDFRILALVGAVTFAALLVFGLFPAWHGSRLSQAAWLKRGSGSQARNGWGLGQPLLVAQMAMSIVLVLAAVVFTRNLLAIQSADPGFDRRNLILFGIRPGASGYEESKLLPFYFQVQERLARTPGVAAVGMASTRPMNVGGWWETVRLTGAKQLQDASINGITPGYLPLYNSRMVAGRNFTWADVAGEAKVAIVGDDLAQKMGGRSILGRTLEFTDGPPGKQPPAFEIVGIAPAIAATSMKDRPFTVWVPIAKSSRESTIVLRTSQPPGIVLPGIRQAMNQLDRNLPLVDVTTMEEQIGKGLERERMFAILCNGFGILALILSLVGLYGVMAYSTSRRRGEIGVRLALGAVPSDVVFMVLREGLRLIAVGILLGAPLVWLGSKYLDKELFQMKPLEPLSLALALIIQLVAAMVAVWIPAARASTLHPAEVLRQD